MKGMQGNKINDIPVFTSIAEAGIWGRNHQSASNKQEVLRELHRRRRVLYEGTTFPGYPEEEPDYVYHEGVKAEIRIIDTAIEWLSKEPVGSIIRMSSIPVRRGE